MYGINIPSPEDIDLFSRIGLYEDPDAEVRDAGDVAFFSEWFDIIPIGGDAEDIRQARLFAFFEPAQVGGVEDNWNCGVELEDDFWSAAGGSWPDCFATASEAVECLDAFISPGGLVERKGWMLV